MIAVCAALVLSLSAAGSPGAAPRRAPRDENAIRAERGLLPRKVRVPPPSRARRIVIAPSAPTYLGEPGQAVAVAPAIAAEEPRRRARARPKVFATAVGVEVDVTLRARWPADGR